MATESLETLWAQWKQERLSAEQAIGQMLQHLRQQERRIAELEGRVNGLELRLPKLPTA